MGLFGKKKKDKEVERATIRCWAMLEKFMDSGGQYLRTPLRRFPRCLAAILV